MVYFFLIFLASHGLIAQSQTDAHLDAPTDILPPEAIEESSRNEPSFENLFILQNKISILEKKVERLEEIVESLQAPLKNPIDQNNPLDEDPQYQSLKDPVLDFGKIKQLAIAKSPKLEELVEKFKIQYKDHPLVAKAHFFLADYYYAGKEYDKSIKLIKEGLILYKGSSETGKGIWVLSLILIEMGKNNDACVSLKKLLSLSQQEVSSDLRQNATEKLRALNCK